MTKGTLHYVSADAVPSKEELDVFCFAQRWMLDSGCGKDLVSRDKVAGYEHYKIGVNPITFTTANGPTTTRAAIPSMVHALDGDESAPYILESTPTVLSVGLRCGHRGFSFI